MYRFLTDGESWVIDEDNFRLPSLEKLIEVVRSHVQPGRPHVLGELIVQEVNNNLRLSCRRLTQAQAEQLVEAINSLRPPPPESVFTRRLPPWKRV